MFDIKKQAESTKVEDHGIFVHLRGLEDDLPMYQDEQKEKPVGITVAGSLSSQFRRVEAQQRKRRLRPKDLTSAQAHEDNLEKVVSCTLAWDGFVTDGAVTPMTPHNARILYTECPWVLDQVLEAMQDHKSFFSKGSQS